jgi:hypothetical protein
LFDRYLDGELSPSLQAELHAHVLSCSTCQSELAMLEACGDVVLFDQREPRLGDEFTDRVMAGFRSRHASRAGRRWARVAMVVGSPLAAAASIMLAIGVLMPKQPTTNSMIASRTEAVSEEIMGGTANLEGQSEEAKKEYKQTPVMQTSKVMESFVAKIVADTRGTVDGARQSVADFELLFKQLWQDSEDQLAAHVPESDTGEDAEEYGFESLEWLRPEGESARDLREPL